MGSHHLNRIEVLYISFKGGSTGETVFFMKSFGFPMWKGSSVASSSNLRHIWVSPSPLFTSAYFVQNIVWYPWWHLITIETVDEPRQEEKCSVWQTPMDVTSWWRGMGHNRWTKLLAGLVNYSKNQIVLLDNTIYVYVICKCSLPKCI